MLFTRFTAPNARASGGAQVRTRQPRSSQLFALFALLALVSTPVQAQESIFKPCTNGVQVRKEWRNLTPTEQQTYLNAVKKLIARPAPTQPSFQDKMANKHNALDAQIHGCSMFLPWHRLFMREYEIELQKIDAKITLPYWNWAYDSQFPDMAPVWGDTMFGGNGDTAKDNCVTTGPFAGHKPMYGQDGEHCLRRIWDGGDKMSAVASLEQMNAIITTSNDYDTFYQAVQGNPHGMVHVNIGGDMGVMYSPNDPIFWLHHTFVDKVWWNWQKMEATRLTSYGGIYFDQKDTGAPQRSTRPAAATDPVEDYPGMPVDKTFKVEDLCYTYQELQDPAKTPANPVPAVPVVEQKPVDPVVPVVEQKPVDPVIPVVQPVNPIVPVVEQKAVDPVTPTDPAPTTETTLFRRSPLVAAALLVRRAFTPPTPAATDEIGALRVTKPLPDHWIKLNQLAVTTVRANEKQYKEIVEKINALDGYVSPCSAWNRDDVLAKVLARRPEVKLSNGGKQIVVKVPYAKNDPNVPRSKQQPLNNKQLEELKTKFRMDVQRTANRPQVQKPIGDVAVALSAIIGEPVVKDDQSPENCYKGRHHGKGFGRDNAPPGVQRRVQAGRGNGGGGGRAGGKGNAGGNGGGRGRGR